MISAHAPGWVAVPFFVFVVVGEIWANYLDVYTAGLVSLAMGIKLRAMAERRWAAGLLGTALAAYAVLVSDFHLAYEDFLILTYLWAPAWAAVVLLSFFVFEGKPRPRARAGRVARGYGGRALSSSTTTTSSATSSRAPRFFNDGLDRGLHGADLSGLVSVAVAAAVYWCGPRLRPA